MPDDSLTLALELAAGLFCMWSGMFAALTILLGLQRPESWVLPLTAQAVDAAAFPGTDADRLERSTAAIEAMGFVAVGDFTLPEENRIEGGLLYVAWSRLMVSADSTIVAAVKQDFTFIGAGGSIGRYVTLMSRLESGTAIVTENSQVNLTYPEPPTIEFERHPLKRTEHALLERHRRRLRGRAVRPYGAGDLPDAVVDRENRTYAWMIERGYAKSEGERRWVPTWKYAARQAAAGLSLFRGPSTYAPFTIAWLAATAALWGVAELAHARAVSPMTASLLGAAAMIAYSTFLALAAKARSVWWVLSMYFLGMILLPGETALQRLAYVVPMAWLLVVWLGLGLPDLIRNFDLLQRLRRERAAGTLAWPARR